jgi:hypothetical protein
LGAQSVDHAVVDLDHVEKDLGSRLPLFENVARRWSGPRDPGASGGRQDDPTEKEDPTQKNDPGLHGF